jgi:hypothetical protein
MKTSYWWARARTWAGLLLGAALLVGLLAALAGCSGGTTGSGGVNYTLGLAGSTADHPSTPPTIAANGPSGTYAFVYDNQIWVRSSGDAQAKQLTHLVLSNGATLLWGPLVWSHSGKYIAFALVQDLNLTPGTPPRTSGPIYYVDTGNGQISVSAGTGSVYGHTYTWIGDSMLLYSSGSGLMLFTLDTPRVWLVRAIPTAPSGGSQADYLFFGDVAAVNGTVYYTRLDVRTPGHTGAIGTASLTQTPLGITDANAASSADLADRLPIGSASTLASLGAVYADPAGNFVAGAWQVARVGFATMTTVQRIVSVDMKAGTVTSRICLNQSIYDSCDASVVAAAGISSWAIHPQLALSPSGKVAYTTDSVYLQSAADKLGAAGWTVPPAWAPDGQGVAVTQLLGQTTDASGVTRYQTNVVLYRGGQAGTTLIAGASNLAWAP